MNLAEIRAKYPQYKDVDDTRLADALYQKYYPHADRREFDARVGLKPYQGAIEGLSTLVGNLPASIAESKANLSQMAAEAVTDFISPRKQVGNTPPLRVTPGAPVAGLLNQPAGVTYDVEGTGFGEVLPDGTISPVSLGPLLPDGVKQAIAQNAARQSLAAQLRGMESRGQQKPFDMQPGLGSDVIQGVAAGVEMIAPAAASMVVRNPAPLVAYFTARSAGTGYGEAKAAGAPNDRARAAAGLYAAAEAVTEAVAGKVFLEGGKTLVRSILKGGAVEGLTEAATEALQALVDAGIIGEDVTLDEALGRIKTAAVAGAAAGAPIAALTHGLRGAGQTEATPQMFVNKPVKPVDPDTPIEERVALPGPQTLLALPSPEAFAPPPATRRQGPAPAVAEKVADDADYAARVALERTKQTETAELLQTARETITPLGTFDVAEIGDDAAGRVRQHRIRMGRPVEAPVTIEDLARAKVPQRRIGAIIAQRRPVTSKGIIRPVDVRNVAADRNITWDDSNFGELAFRTTGQRNLDRMSQAQLNALKTTLEAMPVNAERITVPVAEQSRFTDDQYGKALDALRTQGRYTAKAIKDATGINNDEDVRAIRDAMVRRGQLIERGKNDYRLYDVLGEERQSTPDDLPPGAFKEHVVRRIPVGKVRVRVDGKSVGAYGSGTEARGKVSELRQTKGPKAQIVIEPAEEVAWGVMENRYDQEGNLLGQVVVDTHRDETAAAKAATELNAPADTGARYTATPVPGAAPVAQPAPKRVIEPAALAGRVPEVLKRLNQQAKDRKLPLLGVRVQVKPRTKTMEGDDVEGLYWRKLMQLTAQNLDASMSTDEIVERLGQVMDHETIHALREAGVLGPETAGWKSIMRYARRAKRPGTNETYFEWARRSYTGIPGYTDPSAIEEEAIAEAFRHWASNKRSVVGQPATVFRQLVEWFKRLISAMPEDVFRAIETGAMVEEALTPPGSNQPRARATKAMQEAAAGVTEAVEAKNENAARVRSREYLRARAQAREDRFGRSGPKTVLGTNAGRGYNEADVDTAFPRAVAEKYRKDNGVQTGALHTLLPEDTTYLMRVADAQQRGSNSPGADDVAKAYRALIDETKAMWRALGDVVVEAWTGNGAPYASAAEMLADVAGGRLRMRLSGDLFGPGADNPGHPLNAASGVKTVDGRDLSNNDLFRVVHDIYGYGQSGFRDSPRGAYNAYHEHARLVSPEARRALATETLAQSAWANYGQHLRRRDGTVPRETDVDYLKPSLKEFAEQKAFLLSDELVAADPGWALADAAAGTVEDVPRFSLADRPLYRGTNESPERIRGGIAEGTLFVTPHRDVAQLYGDTIGEFRFRPDAKVLVEGTAEFAKVAGRRRGELLRTMRTGENLASASTDVVNKARDAGYDAVEFTSMRDLGVAVLNPDVLVDPSSIVATEETPRYSKFDDNLPGGRLYGNPNRSPGGALSAPGTPSPAFTSDRPGNQFFGGELAERQLEMARTGERGATMVYLAPDEYLALANAPENPEQVVYDDALNAGYKASTLPSLVIAGYAGNVRAVDSDGAATVRALASRGTAVPVVLYPKSGESLGLVTALEGPDGARVPWPHDGRAENFPERRALTVEGILEGTRTKAAERRVFAERLATKDEPVRFTGPNGQTALASPDMSTPGGFRLTRFDADGTPNGHGELFDTLNAAIETGLREGFMPRIDYARYSINAPFGSRVPTTPPGPMHNIVQQRTEGAVGNFLKNIGRSRAKLFGRGPSIFELRRTLQDKNLSIKELIERVGEAGGNINDLNDTYMLEQLYHGKVFEEIKEREDRLQVPLLEALKDAYDSPEKVTPTDFEDYLYARHAPERNAFLRTRGAPSPNPSGMSDAEAGATLDKFALTGKLPTLERLAALADNIARDTTRTRVEGGLISPEAAAASPYQYYVPLRGLAEEELDPGEDTPQTRARSGKGFSVGGREDRAVTGRSKKAGDLLGHLFLQNTEAVIRAQKNEVALSFMRLMQDNPDAGIGQILKTAPTRRVVGANGMIMEAGDPTYRQQPDIVTAKWKGKEIIARVADPDVARAIKSDYVTSSNMLVNALGRMNRYLAMVNTSLNPEFLISNLARDLQTAGILSQQYDIKGLTGNVIKNAPAAMAGIREVLRKGTANSDWAQSFVEMQEAGGTTEFLGIHDLESKIKQIRNSVTRTGLAPTLRQAAEYGKNVLGFINDYNKIAENAFRLSAYKAARDAGVSIPKAAYLAKNLTINFNKGGEQKSLANSLYLFYNASTQGTFVLLNGLKSKRVQRIVGGIVVAGVMQDILNRALSGDDDDNGVTDYDDIPDYVLATNFVLMDPLGIVPRTKTGGQGYFAFPMPYGFNAFWNLGRNMSAGVSGSPVHNPGKSAMNALMGFTDAFNPLGGVQSVLNFIAPTIADPIVDIITNKDFAGNDIVPERPSFGLPVPDSQKYWSNTNEVPKYIAEQLNSLTGGNEVRKGAVDWSPEVLQYVFDYATGAAGKFATRTAKFGAETVPSLLQGDFENIEVGDIPFARRVVGSVNSRANTERYYAVAEEVETVAAELKMFSESGRVEEARRVFQANPAEVQMIGAFEKANKALSAMRKQIRDLRETEAIPAPRKKEMIDQIKAEQDRLMAMLNKAYFERKRVLALN